MNVSKFLTIEEQKTELLQKHTIPPQESSTTTQHSQNNRNPYIQTQNWRPQRDSNSRCRRERAMS